MGQHAGIQGVAGLDEEVQFVGQFADVNDVYRLLRAQTMVAVLKTCGDNLTRENVMKQAAASTT